MSRNNHGFATPLGVVLALLLLTLPAGAQPVQEKLLQCNTDMELNFTTMNFTAGATVGMSMTLENGPSNDGDVTAPGGNGNPVPVDIPSITFFPDCMAITPGNPPSCTVNPTPELSFVGLTSNTCGTMVSAAVQADGSVLFTFTPSPLTLPAAATADGTTSCQIFFDVMIDSMAPDGAVIESLGLTAVETCAVTDLTDQASGTSSITVTPAVPTLGGAALAVLALVLALGAWQILRQRSASGPAGA